MNKEQEVFWLSFKENKPIYKDIEFGSAWSFGDSEEMADELAELVLKGEKTGTASAFIQYEKGNEQVPQASSEVFDILLNGKDEPVAIIENTKVYITTFDKVTKEHAFKEGEGDKTLEYWRRVHLDFWTKIFKLEGIENVDIEKMKVVCEEFKVVWQG